ncbi:MAG: DUF479 domain-containing protein [Gammaproteobacteria bacterium]|nr:DUF479 domain-containing protein [Gammaproteobacteria bacterium]
MNYLAHVFLSQQTPQALTGALLGDFVKGRALEQWGPEVRTAILLHRAIDRYTDRHPLVRASCGLISAERRRFAGVLVDIFYDHFLARYWSRYSARPLIVFTQAVYRVLLPQLANFPERLQYVLPRMANDDWLSAYAEIESIDAALNGLARRCRYRERAAPLATAVEELQRNYAPLQAHFFEFFPQLQQFATTADVSIAPALLGSRTTG